TLRELRRYTNSSARQRLRRPCATLSLTTLRRMSSRMQVRGRQTVCCIHCSSSVHPQEETIRELPCAARWLPAFSWIVASFPGSKNSQRNHKNRDETRNTEVPQSVELGP